MVDSGEHRTHRPEGADGCTVRSLSGEDRQKCDPDPVLAPEGHAGRPKSLVGGRRRPKKVVFRLLIQNESAIFLSRFCPPVPSG